MKPSEINILVACEESQRVCLAFRERGFNAFSNDTQDCSGGHPEYHLKMDVFEAIKLKKWHCMIGFPPCTYLTYSGMMYWYDEGRAMKRIKAAEFFMQLYEADIDFIAIENPRGIMSKIFREPSQVIHPYYFGERQLKRTCLWLKNLPVLEYHFEDNLFGEKTATIFPEPNYVGLCKKTGRVKKRYFTDALIDNKKKTAKEKSKTFPSIAKAMAEQWGDYLIEKFKSK